MFRFLFPVLLLFTQMAKAEIIIVDVRKNIPLSDEDPSFTDFYISAGENEGLKKNMVVTAFRSLNVRDASGAQSFGEISIPIGQVKILAVYQKIAVAREYRLLPRDVNPMLEQIGLMSGDRIELKDSFVDNSVPKRKPQAVAATKTTAPAAVASPTTVTTVTATTVSTTTPAVAPATAAVEVKTSTPTQKPEDLVDTNPLKLPDEITKTAEESAVPEALLQEIPVNNTSAPASNSDARPVTK